MIHIAFIWENHGQLSVCVCVGVGVGGWVGGGG